MNKLTELAKLTVENYVKSRKITYPPEDFPSKFLKNKAGTFVTIMENGELRGCIGTYLPTKKNIALEVIDNAILAATEDYRFKPIKKEKLPNLSYEVYILSDPKQIKNIKELNPKKFGIIVKSCGFIPGSDTIFSASPKAYGKSGLLLPDLEGIDTVEEQISIACQKAGINPAKEEITIYKFTADKY